ncbi:MAG: ATP-binding protein [Salegentibacter sp.]
MTDNSVSYPEEVDLSNCSKEPIHIIRKSQSYGVIVACNLETLEITQCSENTQGFFGKDFRKLLQQPLSMLLGEAGQEKLRSAMQDAEGFLPEEICIGEKSFVMLPHISEDSLVLDFEPIVENSDPRFFQKQLTRILNKLRSSFSAQGLCKEAASLTREILGYDRVMIYRFDEEWNGEVIAEEKEAQLESWLGLHYPSTDIPAQSRKLFLKHRVRIISDVDYTPVPISPEISPVNGKPLDLSRSGLRGVSPIHIEYLQNMGVGASLTAAIVVNGELWGLIACHHYSAKFIDYYQRESCRFLAQMLSNELALKETNHFLAQTEKTGKLRKQLILQLQKDPDLPAALTAYETKFTQLVSCGGGAVINKEKVALIGMTPSREQVLDLQQNFLNSREEDVFFSRNLSVTYPKASEYSKEASGIGSMRIGEDKYLLWFRPEVIQTIHWGGNPDRKAFYDEQKKRLSPRKSFEKWSQELRGISRPWRDFDISTLHALKESVSHFTVKRQKNEINDLNKRLIEANKELELFSYGLSHDLRAPLRGINGYVHILKEDHMGEISEEGKELVETILGLTDKMNLLIDDILSFSQISAKNLREQDFSVNFMIEEILELFNVKLNYPKTKILVQPDLPAMRGDKRMLFQLWSNLLNNALKYSRKEEHPQVEIGAFEEEGKTIYFIKDNGIGIDTQYADKIFQTFSRLAGKDFKGTGIGLALVKRVLEKHQGEIWIESEKGEGAAFFFYV